MDENTPEVVVLRHLTVNDRDQGISGERLGFGSTFEQVQSLIKSQPTGTIFGFQSEGKSITYNQVEDLFKVSRPMASEDLEKFDHP